eukprot:ANDGO_04952.mRNA.1 Sphingomyelinase phosphodiesterase C
MVTLWRFVLCALVLASTCRATNIGSFWQITDFHTDEFYLPGSDPSCDLPECCRVLNPASSVKAGPFGDFQCDIPMQTTLSAMEFVSAQNPDFVIQSGDIVPHDLQMQNRTLALTRLKTHSLAFQKYFGSVSMLHAIGNHDTFPVDQFDDTNAWDWLLQPLSQDIYAPFLSAEEQVTYARGGYFSRSVSPKMRVIVLNTQYGDPLNFFSYSFVEDPAGQVAWLTGELADARAQKQSIIMVEHIPFGTTFAGKEELVSYSYGDKLLPLFEEYSAEIKVHLAGHVHTDSFRILQRANASSCFGVQHLSPAATAHVGLNPEVREFVYDRDSGEILDIKTYWINLTEANASGSIKWTFAYSHKDVYELPDLNCASFEKLRKSMFSDDITWGNFMVRFRGQNGKPAGCMNDCRTEHLCSMGWVFHDDYKSCMKIPV